MEAIAVLPKTNSTKSREDLKFKEFEDYDSDVIHFEPDYYTDRLDVELGEASGNNNWKSSQLLNEDRNDKFGEKDGWVDDEIDIDTNRINNQFLFYEDELAIEELKTLVGGCTFEFIL